MRVFRYLMVVGQEKRNNIWCRLSSSVHIDNKKKDFLDLDSDPTDGLDDTRVTARKEYSINFTEQENKFCLSLRYNGMCNYIFVNGV